MQAGGTGSEGPGVPIELQIAMEQQIEAGSIKTGLLDLLAVPGLGQQVLGHLGRAVGNARLVCRALRGEVRDPGCMGAACWLKTNSCPCVSRWTCRSSTWKCGISVQSVTEWCAVDGWLAQTGCAQRS
jgi:hypothetical protein